MGLGGAYRSFRFRLDDGGAVANGVGEDTFLVSFLRVQRKLGAGLSLDLIGGGMFNGELTIESSDGDEIGSDDEDNPPFAALTLSGRF